LKWLGRELRIRLAKVSTGDEITLLGVAAKIAWRSDGDTAVIALPDLTSKPCDYAWVFRIRRKAGS
jgi:hypothetical protein